MNKQSNIYTVIYIIVLVVIVGTALALASISLHSRQQANADADKMRQILASVNISTDNADVISLYDRYITGSFIVNEEGIVTDSTPHAAFDVNVGAQVKNKTDRLLPVFQCTLDDGSIKYILPMYGAGLWGPIWGYISVDSNGSTVYGAYFAHQGETPGLGAEIEKPAFSGQFVGKQLLRNGVFRAIAVIKAGMKAPAGSDFVDGVSGGTITSKGVGAMIDNCLSPYAAFLNQLSGHNTIND